MTMSAKKSNDNGFDGLVAIQLCTKSWPGIVNLTKEDLGITAFCLEFPIGCHDVLWESYLPGR
jgi:hypothetical protein